MPFDMLAAAIFTLITPLPLRHSAATPSLMPRRAMPFIFIIDAISAHAAFFCRLPPRF